MFLLPTAPPLIIKQAKIYVLLSENNGIRVIFSLILWWP